MNRKEKHALKERIEYLEQRAAWIKAGEERDKLLAEIERLREVMKND